MADLAGPIVYKENMKQIITAPVLVPGEADHDGDILSEEQIEDVSIEFMEKYRNIDYQHSLNNVGTVVESYITTVPLKFDRGGEKLEIPVGTWIMSVKVNDESTWEKVKKGELTGLSIMGVLRTIMKSKEKEEALKEMEVVSVKSSESSSEKTTLYDIGDFVITHVSLVDEPAVPKAKFVAIKSKQPTEEEKSLFNKFISFIKSDEGKGKQTKKEENEMTEEQVRELFKEELEKQKEEETKTSDEPEDENVDEEEESTDESEGEDEGQTEEEVSQKGFNEVQAEQLSRLIAKEVEKSLKGKGKDTSTKSSKIDFEGEESNEKSVKSAFDASGRFIGKKGGE